MLPFPIIGFVLLGYAIFKLWVYLTYFSFFGVIFLFLVLPIQSYIGNIYSKMRMKATEYTDERVRLVDEFINAIKGIYKIKNILDFKYEKKLKLFYFIFLLVIKFYTWEYQFAKKIDEARRKEINKIKNSLYIYSISNGLFTSTTKTVVYIILVTFYFAGGKITDKTGNLML